MRSMSLWQAFVQFASHRSTSLLLVIWLGFLVSRFALSAPIESDEIVLAFVVMLYWPFQEWWMHRWLLHMRPVRIFGKTWESHFAKVHRLHHESPEDLRYVYLPLRDILSSLFAFVCISALLARQASWVCTFMAAATFSTLVYEWTHSLCHTTYKPKRFWFRKIWQLHRWHHYKNEAYWFSFTVPYLDQWLGTGPDHKAVPKSPTVRRLLGSDAQSD